jgi:hypothetical protein
MGHQTKVREILSGGNKPEYACEVCGRRCASLAEVSHSPAMCTECWGARHGEFGVYWRPDRAETESDRFERFVDGQLKAMRKKARLRRQGG